MKFCFHLIIADVLLWYSIVSTPSVADAFLTFKHAHVSHLVRSNHFGVPQRHSIVNQLGNIGTSASTCPSSSSGFLGGESDVSRSIPLRTYCTTLHAYGPNGRSAPFFGGGGSTGYLNPASSSFIQQLPRFYSATNFFIAANIVSFIACWKVPSLKYKWMKMNTRVFRGEGYRLLTALFVHGSLRHLAMNIMSLQRIGKQVESALGLQRFVFLYILSGVAANYFTFVLGKSPISMGASGSIYGLLASLSVYLLQKGDRMSESRLESIKRTILINFMMAAMQGGGVDNWAHLGGFLSGLLLSVLFIPKGVGGDREGQFNT